MWDTVAWDYKMNRRSPEFSCKGVNVTVIDGALQVTYKGKTIEVLDDDITVGGVRVVVSRRAEVVFFIVGTMRRKKLGTYTAGVSCCNKFVTAQVVRAAVIWTKELTALAVPPEDPGTNSIPQAVNTLTARWAISNPTEEVAVTSEHNLRVGRNIGRVASSPLEANSIAWQDE